MNINPLRIDRMLLLKIIAVGAWLGVLILISLVLAKTGVLSTTTVISVTALMVSITTLVLGYFANRNRKDTIDDLWDKLEQVGGKSQGSARTPSATPKFKQALVDRPQHSTPSVSREEFHYWIEQLQNQLNTLQRKHASSLTEHAVTDVPAGTTSSAPSRPSWQALSPSPPQQMRTSLRPEEQSVVQAYNAAANGDRSVFTGRYQVERIDVANAPDLARDPDMQPRFEASGSGDYLGVRLDGLGNGEVAIVPKLGLTYGEELHQRAGMKRVFTSDGYDPQRRYRNIRLIAPALFRNAGGNAYELVRPGVLDLGQGE